jgi:hypothetical protein
MIANYQGHGSVVNKLEPGGHFRKIQTLAQFIDAVLIGVHRPVKLAEVAFINSGEWRSTLGRFSMARAISWPER